MQNIHATLEMGKNTEGQHQGQKQGLNVALGHFKFSTGLLITQKLLVDTIFAGILVEENLDHGASPMIKKWNDNCAMCQSAVSLPLAAFQNLSEQENSLKKWLKECSWVYFYQKQFGFSLHLKGTKWRLP